MSERGSSALSPISPTVSYVPEVGNDNTDDSFSNFASAEVRLYVSSDLGESRAVAEYMFYCAVFFFIISACRRIK